MESRAHHKPPALPPAPPHTQILDELPGGERTQVCVATFDSSIHFYSLRAGQSQPHMLVVPDVTDVYCPLPGNVVVSLAESRALVGGTLK